MYFAFGIYSLLLCLHFSKHQKHQQRTKNPSNSYLAQTVLEFVADGKLKYLSPLDFLLSPEYPNGKNGITNQTQLIPTNQ